MNMRSIRCIVLLALVLLSGCSSLKPDYSLFKSDLEAKTDALWKRGYGYNNPNPDRLRSGQEALNFDGKPDNLKTAVGDIGGRAIGNVIAFTAFEAIPAVFRGIANKFRR